MNIGNLFGNYESHLQESLKMDGKNTEQTSQAKPSGELASLKEGMVFKGEVLDVSGEKVTIRLENNGRLPARLQGDVQLGIGDELLFSVKENNVSQILIKPLFDSLYSAQTKVLEQALDLAGLSPTEKNFAVAKELMDAGQPLDRGTMTQLLSQSMKFPDAPMSTLVSLNKMNIPVNGENIEQYSRYEALQHQLSGDIENTVSSMTDFSNLFPADSDGKIIFSFVKEMMDMFTEEMPEALVSEDMENAAASLDNEAMEQNEVSQNNLTGDKIVSDSSGGTVSQLTENHMDDMHLSNDNNIIIENNSSDENTSPVISQKDVKALSQQLELSQKDTSSLLQNIKDAGISNEVITNVIRNSSSPEQFLQNMMSAMQETMLSDASLKQLLDSNELKKLFSDMIHKSWSINPNQMKTPKEIDELYDRIQRQSKAFENALNTKGGDAKNFQQNSQNMRQNMSFMEQLNHQMIYAQMPLKLSGQNANSELYIYADKKKLMEKKDGISVMLHLDMEHLGQTDIKVTLTQSNVHARFYLNDQESVDIVTDNMGDLAKQLGLRGFSLTNEVVKRKPAESINKVVDEIIDENAEKSIKRYTFDART